MNLFCRFFGERKIAIVRTQSGFFSAAEFCIDVVAGIISLNVRFNPC